jgi:hypothetical protein
MGWCGADKLLECGLGKIKMGIDYKTLVNKSLPS